MDGLYCDIYFRVSNTDFDLHANVMAFRMSNYIKAHYDTGFKLNGEGHSDSKRIVINDFPGGADCFEQVYKFCYKDDTFSITLSNVLPLYYAAEYFGMVNEGNLMERVNCYLDKELIGETVKDIKNTKKLYKIAIDLEKEFALPNNVSLKCMNKIASFVGESSSSFVEDFLDLLELPETADVVQVAKNLDTSLADISSFVAKVTIRAFSGNTHPSLKGDNSSALIEVGIKRQASLNQQIVNAKALQILWKEVGSDMLLIDEHLATSLIELGEDILTSLSLTTNRIKFMGDFLRHHQKNNFKDISSQKVTHFADLCIQMCEREGSPVSDETFLFIVRILIHKLQETIIYLPPKLSCYWVHGAGCSEVNGKYTYDGEFNCKPKYSKIQKDGSVLSIVYYAPLPSWYISVLDEKKPGGSADKDFYFVDIEQENQNFGSHEMVPLNGWKVARKKVEWGCGRPPAPTVLCATYV